MAFNGRTWVGSRNEARTCRTDGFTDDSNKPARGCRTLLEISVRQRCLTAIGVRQGRCLIIQVGHPRNPHWYLEGTEPTPGGRISNSHIELTLRGTEDGDGHTACCRVHGPTRGAGSPGTGDPLRMGFLHLHGSGIRHYSTRYGHIYTVK